MRSFLPNHPLINALTCCGNTNCGKEAEPFKLKMCTACCSKWYCTIDCQKAHRKNHKSQCKEDAQNLQRNVDYIKENSNDVDGDNDDDDDNDELFQCIPPQDDCPLCMLPLPIKNEGSTYMACCGKSICVSCCQKSIRVTAEKEQHPCCPFCREPAPSSESEVIVRIERRMEMNDSEAIYSASNCYQFGKFGLSKDEQKAFKLSLSAAELGHSDACNTVAAFYYDNEVVPQDRAKAREYLEKAVKNGDIIARHNMGVIEEEEQNYRLASRHWLISAAAGYTNSLIEIAKFHTVKIVTKKEYSAALASYVKVHKDEWSIEREVAAKGGRIS